MKSANVYLIEKEVDAQEIKKLWTRTMNSVQDMILNSCTETFELMEKEDGPFTKEKALALVKMITNKICSNSMIECISKTEFENMDLDHK